MTCNDCFHCDVCEFWKTISTTGRFFSEGECKFFKDKSKIVELPYTPLPIAESNFEDSSDVFCPCCYTNLSGHYYGGDYEVPKIVPCYECGTWLDGTKVITKEEAEKALKERESK